MENVSTEITKISPCRTKIKFVIDKTLVEKFSEEVYRDIQKNAVVSGFRKGTVPIEIIKSKYSDIAKEKIINKTISETLFPVLKEKNINFVEDTLEIKKLDFDLGKNCVYELELELEPEFKLKNYKGLKLKKEIREVSQKDIDAAVKDLLERNARLVVSTKEKILDSDIKETSTTFCVVEYKAFLDGKELKDLEGKNVLIDLSSNRLPVGLKEGLVGMTKNEQKKIKVTLPANFPNPELVSKEIDLDLKLVEIKEKQYPTLDTEFAKDLGYKDLDDLYNAIRESIQSEYELESLEKLKQQIYDQLVQEHNFEISKIELERYEKSLIESMKKTFISRGGKETEFNLSEEDKQKIRQKSLNELKLKYILKKIVQEEKIQVSQEELEKEKGKYKTLYPGRENEVEKYFNENINHIVSQMLENKILDLIKSTAKIKEVKIK
jgi:trigger factor